ncbi:DUF4233 domain-containing protein [Actinokineospora inagensis]|uniref:DUF4233 domain-containing protein n=1 Tax=Actinokineospora inagensis TaxID=103730 RepID=UPI000423C80F|nr:DUF4233 domain-containing protein [Actinokineospora inagensis]
MTTPDPMKGFRGVMSAMLILEAIVVLLALLVVAKSSGLATWQGWSVGAMAFLLIATCAFVARPWGLHLALTLQAIACLGFFITPALGAVGVAFALGWTWMLWARHDVLKRMSEGRLSSQQPPTE